MRAAQLEVRRPQSSASILREPTHVVVAVLALPAGERAMGKVGAPAEARIGAERLVHEDQGSVARADRGRIPDSSSSKSAAMVA